MKAVVVRDFGAPEVLRLESVDRPAPSPGQVVVEVAFAGVTGTYAEYVAASVDDVYRVPDALALETAAAVTSQGLTAYHVVHPVWAVRVGHPVLVHAAAGGVGQLAVQLARRAGARVFGATSHPSKAEAIAGAGAEPVVIEQLLALDGAPDGKMANAAERLLSLVAGGDLRVAIAATLPLGEAAEAHRRLEAGETRGKLLLHL